jgi:hypothetical protein
LAGDWNGDLVDTVGLYDGTTSTFYLRNYHAGGAADVTFPYGPPVAGWLPVVGDWNGDRIDSAGLYAPTTGVFYLRNSQSAGSADHTFPFGAVGLEPIRGNWDAN